MDAINSSSFFHYRSNKDDFYKIIKKGFSFRYSFEPLGATFAKANNTKHRHSKSSINENDSKGIALPMLCFCDIPIMRASKHRKNYGEYCIGVDKEMMIERFGAILNPVFYVSSEVVKKMFEGLVTLKRELAPTIEEIAKIKGISKECVSLNDYFTALKDPLVQMIVEKEYHQLMLNLSLMHFMALCKLYSGKNYKGEDVCYYDEREWRMFLYDMKQFKWVYDTTSGEFEKVRAKKNKSLEKKKISQVLIQPESVGKIISHIIVPTDDDIPEIIKEIMKSPTIFGHKLSIEAKQLIISKVTSFERIEKDY